MSTYRISIDAGPGSYYWRATCRRGNWVDGWAFTKRGARRKAERAARRAEDRLIYDYETGT